MILRLPLSALLCAGFFASFIVQVYSHGLSCTPRQRAAYVNDKCGFNLDIPKDPVIDYCAHCLNAGGVASTKANLPPGGWKVYEPIKDFDGTATHAGLCGDPKGNVDHMIGGDFMPYSEVPIVAHYKKGAEVDFMAELDTNHNGYFEFFLCDLDKCGPDINRNCFTDGHCHKLMRVAHPDCEDPNVNTHYDCGPIDKEYPGRWYVPCRKTGHVGVHLVGGDTGTMRYKLPPDVECRHCLIQWYWATANSCAPRGFMNYMDNYNDPFGTTCESDGGGRGAHRDGMAECGGDSVPEEFWSCADVQITKDGKAAGPVKSVGGPPKESPGVKPSDGEEVKEDPDGVLDKAKEELEKDIDMAANDGAGDKKKDEVNNATGDCLAEGDPCDGNKPCCDHAQFCVMSYPEVKFTCRFWWSLWKDSEAREADMKK